MPPQEPHRQSCADCTHHRQPIDSLITECAHPDAQPNPEDLLGRAHAYYQRLTPSLCGTQPASWHQRRSAEVPA